MRSKNPSSFSTNNPQFISVSFFNLRSKYSENTPRFTLDFNWLKPSHLKNANCAMRKKYLKNQANLAHSLGFNTFFILKIKINSLSNHVSNDCHIVTFTTILLLMSFSIRLPFKPMQIRLYCPYHLRCLMLILLSSNTTSILAVTEVVLAATGAPMATGTVPTQV